MALDVDKEIDGLFDDLDQLLKNPEVGAALSDRGINVSLAMVAADGLRAYMRGDKPRAADDLGTVAEEIRGRIAMGVGTERAPS